MPPLTKSWEIIGIRFRVVFLLGVPGFCFLFVVCFICETREGIRNQKNKRERERDTERQRETPRDSEIQRESEREGRDRGGGSLEAPRSQRLQDCRLTGTPEVRDVFVGLPGTIGVDAGCRRAGGRSFLLGAN